MEQLQTTSKDLYMHSFAVSNAVMDMKSSLFEQRNHTLRTAIFRLKDDDFNKQKNA